MKKLKKVIWLIIGLIIGISTTVGAATIFRSQDITYSSSATTKTNVKDSLDELYTKASKIGQCPERYLCRESLIQNVQLGDYISMVPTSTSFTPPSVATGYTKAQNTINPSELNLWRVIKKGTDGSVEVVSEHVSSVPVIFYGSHGYSSFVGGLYEISTKYSNSRYVINTRIVGAGPGIVGGGIGLTAYLDQSKITSKVLPWKESTKDFSNETLGGGDIEYQNDCNLIKNVLGTLKATDPNGKVTGYWLSSRSYIYVNDNYWAFYGRVIDGEGELNHDYLYVQNSGTGHEASFNIRVILTLGNVRIKSGDGKSAETAYTLE